uniref:Uncharacterized protein n=1 Tax=Anguilla anguilla TaxID=7936 RepID=A0A0E9WK65_ANGAN
MCCLQRSDIGLLAKVDFIFFKLPVSIFINLFILAVICTGSKCYLFQREMDTD